MIKDNIKKQILESARIKEEMARSVVLDIHKAAEMLMDCINSGWKIYWCGNGGSASDAQHLAIELMGGTSGHDR
tara:strand:- start:271 stop:492 length:222 start_codon:yes stop_codon:yes gene_type:complete